MTIRSGFFNSVNADRLYDAEDFTNILSPLLPEGIIPTIGEAFSVTFDGTMTVVVESGRAWLFDRWLDNDAAGHALLFDTAAPILDRIDTIVFSIDHTLEVRAGTIDIVKGVPSSDPVPTDPIDTSDLKQFVLMDVYIAAGSSGLNENAGTSRIGTLGGVELIEAGDAAKVKDAISGSEEATTLADGDTFGAVIGAVLKKITWANIKARLKTYFDTIYEVANTYILKADTAEVLTAGFGATAYNAGTKSSGTFIPDEADGNFQYAVNGGDHTLVPPTNDCTIIIQYTNNASAGTITPSGFNIINGDTLTTTDGDDFFLAIIKCHGFSSLTVMVLQ